MSEIRYEFFDKNYLQEPDYVIRRLDKKGIRYYFKLYDNKIISYAPGVTSILNKVMPFNQELVKWISKMGYRESLIYKRNAAHYGTYLHVLYARLLLEEKIYLYDLWFLEDLEKFCLTEDINFIELKLWLKNNNKSIRKDVLSFLKWRKDYNIIPLAIEFPFIYLREDSLHYSGTIDLVARATIKDEEKIILVDFKSGKYFWQEHEIQLHAYREAWNDLFPEREIELIYNFRPKDFVIKKEKEKTKITYEFKNQTNSKNLEKWDLLLQLFYCDENFKFDLDYTDICLDIHSNIDNFFEEIKYEEEYYLLPENCNYEL